MFLFTDVAFKQCHRGGGTGSPELTPKSTQTTAAKKEKKNSLTADTSHQHIATLD